MIHFPIHVHNNGMCAENAEIVIDPLDNVGAVRRRLNHFASRKNHLDFRMLMPSTNSEYALYYGEPNTNALDIFDDWKKDEEGALHPLEITSQFNNPLRTFFFLILNLMFILYVYEDFNSHQSSTSSNILHKLLLPPFLLLFVAAYQITLSLYASSFSMNMSHAFFFSFLIPLAILEFFWLRGCGMNEGILACHAPYACECEEKKTISSLLATLIERRKDTLRQIGALVQEALTAPEMESTSGNWKRETCLVWDDKSERDLMKEEKKKAKERKVQIKKRTKEKKKGRKAGKKKKKDDTQSADSSPAPTATQTPLEPAIFIELVRDLLDEIEHDAVSKSDTCICEHRAAAWHHRTFWISLLSMALCFAYLYVRYVGMRIFMGRV